MKEKTRFDGINGLRAIAAIGIIIMHVAANTTYNIGSPIYTKIVPMFGLFTFLFMVISAFCLCCGYYDKLKNNKITLNEFYKRRYSRIFPFFVLIVLAEVVYQHDMAALYEGTMDLTLSFAFLPNPEITITGVGWTLGVIFAFYMLFPFFVFLIDNKKRGWLTFIVSILIALCCVNYFFTDKFVVSYFTPKHNFLYCFMFFAVGGLIYLYKDDILKLKKYFKIPCMLLCIALSVIFAAYITNYKEYRIFYLVPLFATYLIYTITYGGKILDNKITKFISKYSMEIYLCHMLIFRIVEKLGLLYLFGNGILSYIVTSIIVIIGSFILSIGFRYVYDLVYAKLGK